MFADSHERVMNRILREDRNIAVICHAGRVRTMKASELPDNTPKNLLGVYDSTVSPDYLLQDLIWADKNWAGE